MKLDIVKSKMADAGLNHQEIAKECSFALQAINRSSQLKKCSIESKQSAILNIAQTGLTLNPIYKYAYLVPRYIYGQYECVLEPSYQGLVKLITDTGSVKAIQAKLVYENDVFEYTPNDFKTPIIHKSNPLKDRGAVIGVYAVALLNDNSVQSEVMNIDELHEIRSRSESYKAFMAKKIKSCVWTTDEGEMMRKTVIKRIFKYLPKSDKIENVVKAISLDDQDYKPTDSQIEYAYSLLETSTIIEDLEYANYEHRIKMSSGSSIQAVIKELKGKQNESSAPSAKERSEMIQAKIDYDDFKEQKNLLAK